MAVAISTVPALFLIGKATLILSASLVIGLLLRRRSGATRHLVYASTLAGLLLLPLASYLAPAVAIEVAVPANPVRSAAVTRAPASPVASDDLSDPAVPVSGTKAFSFPSEELWLGIWLLGVLVSLLPVVGGLSQLRQLIRSGKRCPDSERLVTALGGDAVGRNIVILRHTSISGPITCGLLKPTILLPADNEEWTADAVRRALVHEIEHVRRGDWMTHLGARVVCALYWFHPLAWLVRQRLILEAERACDDAVVQREDAAEYAALLVNVARRTAGSARQPILAMANRKDLSARVSAILDGQQVRGRVNTSFVAAALGVAIVSCTVVAAVTIVEVAAAAAPTLELSPDRAIAKMPEEQAAVERVAPAVSQPVAGSAQTQVPVVPPLSFQGTVQIPAAGPVFEVVSIKPNNSNASLSTFSLRPNGSLTAVNVSARTLISQAYFPAPIDIVDLPDWVTRDRFDVSATSAVANPTPDQRRAMMLAMLVDHFRFSAHFDTREMDVFKLVLARADRLGPNLRPAEIDCAVKAAADRAAAQAAQAARQPVPRPIIPRPGEPLPPCVTRSSDGEMEGDQTMVSLATFLRQPAGRYVVDETGLTGYYRVRLEYDPVTGPRLPSAVPNVDDRPTIFTAVQDQLGLKLESSKALLEVLVVDRIERPTEN